MHPPTRSPQTASPGRVRAVWSCATAAVLLACFAATCFALLDAVGRMLALNTLLLVAATLALSLPAGTLLACLLARTDLPARRFWAALLLLQLFVPLYLQAAAWKAGFGLMGWFTRLVDTDVVWLDHWRGAIWVHAVTALPWVVLIVGAGLRLVEPELEEDALLDASPGRVFRRVTLRRSLAAVAVAALWVAVQTAGEMSATNLFRIRTFAEEIYTSYAVWADSREALADVLPMVLLLACLVVLAVPLAARLVTRSRRGTLRPPLVFPLGRWRWPAAALVAGLVVLFVGLPLGSLVYQAGIEVTRTAGGVSRGWSLQKSVGLVAGSPAEFADEFRWSLVIAVLAASAATALGLVAAWRSRRGGARALAALTCGAVALALPGPLLAIGVMKLMNHPEVPGLVALYDYTVAAPVLALVVRTLPLSGLVLWFALRSVPEEMLESAALEGAGPLARFCRIALPQRWPAVAAAWLVAFALSLGDLSATLLVLPPGVETLQSKIFSLVHSAVEDQVAGICLAQVALIAATTAAAWWLQQRAEGRRRG